MSLMQDIFSILQAGAASAMTTEQIIEQEIKDWLTSSQRSQMLAGERYYKGDTDILQRVRTVVGEGGKLEPAKNLADNRLVHQFIRKLTDQKVGYLLSKPIAIQTDNAKYQELLGDLFDKNTLRLLKNIGKEAINKGKAWVQVYYNPSGQLAFKKIPSEEIIPLWVDSAHTELQAVIRTYDVTGYEGTTKKNLTKVEYWDTQGVKKYELVDGKLTPDMDQESSQSHFSAIVDGVEQAYNWERVPFICFKYNDEELPLIQFLKSLVDDYDKRKSDNSNNLEDLPNSIFVIKGYDGTEAGELRKNLSTYRLIKVDGEGNSGVDTISLEIDTEAYKTHMEMNRKDIYEFGRGVDTSAKEFSSNASGVALRSLYNDLDMDANTLETEFQASLEQLCWFIDMHLINSGQGDYTKEPVEFLFNRDILINETDTITNVKNSVGILSQETILANHPWVQDAKEELKRVQEEEQAAPDDPQGYGGLGKDKTPPEGGGTQ
ncbi:phage portal protein [Paenibacillus gansuensis]|uniref:Phage portal protein n=1 Tax=Paenibacillus gansuensis TaxID=306542 RepID=A0ABW5PEI0_9BACL